MAKKSKHQLCQAANGLYVRNLGWKSTPRGPRQHKFYLGRDAGQASVANSLLEELWAATCRRWERSQLLTLKPQESSPSNSKLLTDESTGVSAILTIGVPETESAIEGRPVWDETMLVIAEAIRQGEKIARVPVPDFHRNGSGLVDPSIGLWLDRLREDFPHLRIELADEAAHAEAEREIRTAGRQMLAQGRRLLGRKGQDATLHVAFDAYAAWIEKKFVGSDQHLTSWGRTQQRQVHFLRQHLPSCPLNEMTTHRIEEDLVEILRRRPMKPNGKRVSVTWARNCIKQFRHFLKWLSKSPEFQWKRPGDLDIARIQIVGDEESTSAVQSMKVSTYTDDELKILWEHATPLQRLFLLIALNCGFGQAELASLELDEVHLHQQHPHGSEVGFEGSGDSSWIFRVRRKTGVYGEWSLWSETTRAIEWWLSERQQIDVAPNVTTLLVGRTGRRYDARTAGGNPNQQLPNSWAALTRRIRESGHPEFRALSFNKLRKTAGNLVRKVGDGEIAGVFLCHGTPVRSDRLLDLYTNRPFAKLFDALERVGDRLRPLWSAVDHPFPQRAERHSELSPARRRKIEMMREQGFRPEYIAQQLNLSIEEVRRRGRSEPVS